MWAPQVLPGDIAVGWWSFESLVRDTGNCVASKQEIYEMINEENVSGRSETGQSGCYRRGNACSKQSWILF